MDNNRSFFRAGRTLTIFLFIGLSPLLWVAGESHSREGPIKVAAIFSLSGPAADTNQPSVRGVMRAVRDINNRGGLLGRPLEIEFFDNLSTPIGSHKAAKNAAASGAIAIIGAMWSSHSMPIAKVAQAEGVPMISNTSTHPALTRIGNYVFRVCFTDDFQGAVIAKFAIERLGAKSAVVLTDVSSNYSLRLSEIFQQHFKEMGGTVPIKIAYERHQSEFDSIIEEIKPLNADVVLISGHDESPSIAYLIQKAGIRSVPIGGDGWTDNFSSQKGMFLKRAYFTTHWTKEIDSPTARLFVEQTENPHDLQAGTALAYDAVTLLADAVTRAGSLKRPRIRDALADTRNFNGVTGTIRFDEHGDPVKQVVVLEVKDGSLHFLELIKPDLK